MMDDITGFDMAFADPNEAPKAEAQRKRGDVRKKAEHDSQRTSKQRKRGGMKRDKQINFRCSQTFLDSIADLQKAADERGEKRPSTADILEDALSLYAKQVKRKGGA